MLDGVDKAQTGNDASGITMQAEHYIRKIGTQLVNVFDTAGLNEGAEGSVPPEVAAVKLWQLIKNLRDGVHLLVFVMRDRITSSTQENYRLFYQSFCDKKVPIVLVSTGFDFATNWETWWRENKEHYDKHDMKFSGQISITSACKPDGTPCVPERYKVSKKKLEDLIMETYERGEVWKMEDKSWFERSLLRMLGFFGGKNPDTTIVKVLMKHCEVPKKIAAKRVLEAREQLGKH